MPAIAVPSVLLYRVLDLLAAGFHRLAGDALADPQRDDLTDPAEVTPEALVPVSFSANSTSRAARS